MLFYFKSPNMPTEFNIAQQLIALGHQTSNSEDNTCFNDNHLALAIELSETLEHKHKLACFLNDNCGGIAPPTYPIDATHCLEVCQPLRTLDNRWILKPALLNNGDGIRLFNNIDEVVSHFAGNQRYDGPHVLQHYIEPPHCLQGHKYSIRLFMVICNDLSSYLYPHGYFNIAKSAYQYEFEQAKSHLTNEHLSHGSNPDSIQIPTNRAPHFERIMQSLSRHCRSLAQAIVQRFAANASATAMSLFGVDYMLDENLQAWLLEINHGPCFPVDANHVLQGPLYQGFWRAVVAEFVLPIAAQRQPALNQFIALRDY